MEIQTRNAGRHHGSAANVDVPCSAKLLYPLEHSKIAIDISIPNQSLSKGYGIYIYRSDSVGLSTESQYYYDKYIYFQVPKGFQRVYRYLHSAIPKSIIRDFLFSSYSLVCTLCKVIALSSCSRVTEVECASSRCSLAFSVTFLIIASEQVLILPCLRNSPCTLPVGNILSLYDSSTRIPSPSVPSFCRAGGAVFKIPVA